MSLLKRTLASLKRNPGRSILIFAILFALGSLSAGAISVHQAVQNIESNLRADIPLVATVDIDREAILEHVERTDETPPAEFFSFDYAEKLNSLPYVGRQYISVGAVLLSDELQMYDRDMGLEFLAAFGQWNVFGLTGFCSTHPLDISEGVIRISSGRMFTEEELNNVSYVMLISEELAALNNLHIGSSLLLRDIVWRDIAHDTQIYIEEHIFSQTDYTFEIVGIFEVTSEMDTGDDLADDAVFEGIANRMYVPNPAAVSIQSHNTEQRLLQNPNDPWLYGNPDGELTFRDFYTFNSTEDMEQFIVAAQNYIPEFYTVLTVNDSFQFDLIVSPMNSLLDLVEMVLVAAIAATVIIVFLLLMLTLRDRKHEIGIYLALGDKKVKVISQMIFEVLFVGLIAIALALFVGNLLSRDISESMLQRDLIAAQDDSFGVRGLEGWGFTGRADATPETVLAAYTISLDSTTVLTFFVGAFAVLIIATALPMLYIVRLDPKKILM